MAVEKKQHAYISHATQIFHIKAIFRPLFISRQAFMQ